MPTEWGTALVTPLFKKGDRSDWANYRLISLLSVVGKCFEAVLAARISEFLDESEGLSEFQCGFRKGRRCQHHTFVLAEAIKSNARQGKRTYAAFWDVKKAYPTMRRAAMLGRLYDKIGDGRCCCRVWRVVERMLRAENCRSKIVVDGAESEEYTVGHGAREGAVLSPVLYAVFIDGIIERLAACEGVTVGGVEVRALLYADDVVLVADTADDLRRMLAEAQCFANDNSFQFSQEKSQIVVFGGGPPGGPSEGGEGDDEDNDGRFMLSGREMARVDEYTYLGLVFHRSLGSIPGDARDVREKFDLKFGGKRFLDDGKDLEAPEERVVSGFYRDDVGRWMARTLLIGDEDNEDGEIPYTVDNSKNETDMKKMIDKYDAEHKITQESRKIRDPWDSQRERIRRKLAK